MSYKKIDPCLKKAFDDEMLFVLMARDETAPHVIFKWIEINIGRQPKQKLLEAWECAFTMLETCLHINQVKDYAERSDNKYESWKDLHSRIILSSPYESLH